MAATARTTTAPELLAALVTGDATRPRLTWYDDADGATRGERIELSARVLANWVAKAANLLVDDLDVERGDVVALDLPAHWRGLYWALAVWRVGAAVSLDADPDAVVWVTDRPRETLAAQQVAVSLPALARSWTPGGDALPNVPAGTVDDAGDLANHPDVFEPFDPPDAGDAALAIDGRTWSAGELLDAARHLAAEQGWAAGERVQVSGSRLADVLLPLLAAWSTDGSAVLVRTGSTTDPGAAATRAGAERVTSAYGPTGTPASPP